MKQEDFFTIMDCASDADITEMMQHRRFRQVPSGEEEIRVKQTEQQKKNVFRITRRGVVTGSAVAAAMLALNIGLGGFMLYKSADDSVSIADSEVIEMTEAAAETTVTESGTEETVTTAAKRKSAAKQNEIKSAAEKAAETQTSAAPKQTVRAQETAPVQQTQVQQTPAAPAQTENPKNTKLTYSLIPTDRTYETTGTNEKAPVVFHAKAGELIKMQITVQNDPGVAEFFVSYKMKKFDMLSGTGLQDHVSEVRYYYLAEDPECDDCVLSVVGEGDGSSKVPDGAALAECTLIAPTQPGRYVIQKYNYSDYMMSDVDENGNRYEYTVPFYNVYADAFRKDHFDCDILGAEIIVDEAEAASPYLVDPETVEGSVIYFEPVTAHTGQKNVPVNLCIKGADPFVYGNIEIGYDPALKSQLFDYDTMDGIEGLSDSGRLGVSVEGTLLKDTMMLKTSTISGCIIDVGFNNFREFGFDEEGMPTVFHNGETQADAVISEDGVLLTMYFDMPEECGTYRIFAYESRLGGGAQEEPGGLSEQTIKNSIPCDIKVIP